MEEIIKIKNLNKSFKEVRAVNDLTFKVKKGEFFAFLGINGAGKSTTISIMCGELTRDSGEVIINGHNIDDDMNEIKKHIGVVYQNNVLDKMLSVYDNLFYRSALYNMGKDACIKKIKEYAALLDFENLLKRQYGKLSGGQKRRVDIARALLHDPDILILDEPTTGLDPQTRKLVWQVLDKLRKERELTIFLTTHYMEEVVNADYVVILNEGKIVAEGTPIELKNKYTGDFITIYHVEEEKIKSMGYKYEPIHEGFRIEVANTAEATKIILKNAELFKDYEIIKGNMDDVFLNATGIKLGE